MQKGCKPKVPEKHPHIVLCDWLIHVTWLHGLQAYDRLLSSTLCHNSLLPWLRSSLVELAFLLGCEDCESCQGCESYQGYGGCQGCQFCQGCGGCQSCQFCQSCQGCESSGGCKGKDEAGEALGRGSTIREVLVLVSCSRQ